jgi:hypothetical protein
LPHPAEFKRNWRRGHGAAVYDPWTAQYTVPPHPLPQQRFYDTGCDPTMEAQDTLPPQGMLPPQQGYLSDELEPMMQMRPGSHNGAAIITDQP